MEKKKNILITGAGGMLGSAFAEILIQKGYSVRALDHTDLDVTDRAAVLAEAEHAPDWIIHTAGIVNADFCEENRNACFKSHVEGTKNVVLLAKQTGAKLFYPQSFLIFDGAESPITETTVPHPLSVYGEVKWDAEQIVHAMAPHALIVRMAGFFGGDEKDKNFVGKFTNHLRKCIKDGTRTIEVGDRVWQPTFTEDLARNSVALLEEDKEGLYTMASKGEASFFDVATAMVDILGLGDKLEITEVSAAAIEKKTNENARRPGYAEMENKRLMEEGLDNMRPWREALREYLDHSYFQEIFKN